MKLKTAEEEPLNVTEEPLNVTIRNTTFIDPTHAEYPSQMKEINQCHVFLFLFTIALAGFSGGYVLGLTNQFTPMLDAQYGWEKGHEQTLFNSLLASSGIFGVVLGCAVAGKLIQYGRRMSIILAIFIYFIGTGVSLYQNIWVFLTSRVISGFAYGISCVAAPRFQEEYIPPHLTSKLQPNFVVMTSVGSVCCSLSAYLLPPDDAPPDVLKSVDFWRYLFSVQIIPLIVCLSLLLTVVTTDSPKFYLMKNDTDQEKAVKVVQKIYAGNDLDMIVDYIRGSI